MRKTALALAFALVLPTLAVLRPHPASYLQGQTKMSTKSKVACSDSTTLLPDKRTPETCAQSDFALYGRPVMFSPRDGIVYGVSVAPDKPGDVTIWMDNQTEKQQTTYICCNATFVQYIDLYDQSGQRIPSRIEINNEKSPLADQRDLRMVAGCGCSGWSTVPPHSLKVVDHGELNLNYTLTPGRYTIVEYPRRLPNAPAAIPSPTLPASGPRLAITLP